MGAGPTPDLLRGTPSPVSSHPEDAQPGQAAGLEPGRASGGSFGGRGLPYPQSKEQLQTLAHRPQGQPSPLPRTPQGWGPAFFPLLAPVSSSVKWIYQVQSSLGNCENQTRPAFNAPLSARQGGGPRECQVITTPWLLLPGAQLQPQPRLGLNGLGLPFSCMKWASAAHSQGCCGEEAIYQHALGSGSLGRINE